VASKNKDIIPKWKYAGNTEGVASLSVVKNVII
jgi:hypothetical protein